MSVTQSDPGDRAESGSTVSTVDELVPMTIRKRVKTRRQGSRRRMVTIGFLILAGLLMLFSIGWYIWQDAFY